MINESLRPLAVPVDDLVPDPDNARDHDERNLEAIKASLTDYGQQKPIVINRERVVIAGNGTLQAAKELGWTEIAAVTYDGAGLPEGFALADNRSAELARWDYRTLAVQMQSLQERGFDLERLGWQQYEVRPLLEARWTPPGVSSESFETSESQNQSPLKLTSDQREVVERAIAAVRREQDDPKMPEGRAVELICADYLSGAVDKALDDEAEGL